MKQIIKAWAFPCEKKLRCISWNTSIDLVAVLRTKKQAVAYGCPCGKNCPPERVTITVERG